VKSDARNRTQDREAVRGGKEQSTKERPYRDPAGEEEAGKGGGRDVPSHAATGYDPPSGGE
jgi:hypothetical protein